MTIAQINSKIEQGICPFCDIERGKTCDCLEPIQDKCTSEGFLNCFDFLTITAEIGDVENMAIDEWEDKTGF